MASSSFRDSINSLGWARRDADLPVNTSQQSGLLSSLKSLNPFGDRGYVQLPTTEGAGAPLPAPSRREEEEGWFACESTRVFLLLHPRHISLFISPIPRSSSQGRTCAVSTCPCLKPPHTHGLSCLSRIANVFSPCHRIVISSASRLGWVAAATKTNLRGIVSRWDRLLIFGACNLGALACFVICIFLFPAISVASPRKLVVL